VRDRPLAQQTQADQAHAKFKDEKSEFSGYLSLWRWIHDSRGGADSHRLSNRQYETLLRQNFINPRRLREWRDVHTQLHTVVAEHGWKLNSEPASYEQLHLSMLAGLLGNLGYRPEEEDVYLGARGIKFYRHPGAHLKKKPGRWIVCAELVETTRLFGRGIAAIDPAWLEQVGGHLLRKQLLDPHWEKRKAEVTALERATLYGLVVYSGRRVPYARADLAGAREIFIREALVEGDWDTPLNFLAANRKLVRQVQELEHKSRRQDVLVDDALIYAFYDQQLPADICTGAGLERWYRDEKKRRLALGDASEPLLLTRDELMRHEAAGITTQAFPKTLRLGGIDCSVQYLHEPGDPRDGLTVTVPLFVLNQVSEERAEWLVPGMLKDKIQALLKSLPQKPRARLVPLPETALRMADSLSAPASFGAGSLVDALIRQVKSHTQLDMKRADFKHDMVAAHLFMNFRVVDEHGRQLGQGRNLGGLKAEWGSQARGAFQALAVLKARPALETPADAAPSAAKPDAQPSHAPKTAHSPSALTADAQYTQWTFGELPELLEIRKGGQTLIGFPALVDAGEAVRIEVFDEPEVAALRHRQGLCRLFSLQLRDALKYLEKNIPELQSMSMAYMPLGGTRDELIRQIVDAALERAFLMTPLPSNDSEFKRRVEEGRGRLTLIAQEVARLTGLILTEYAAVTRKLKDTKQQPEVVADINSQLQRLLGKRFVTDTPASQIQHLPRYLKGMVMRLDKLRADPSRDAARLAELKPIEQRYWRLMAERKGVQDERTREFRWLLEELRISLFAQELRTPQPVSVKRLDKAWALINQ
jgi:ATP-dependent helicase HrpA